MSVPTDLGFPASYTCEQLDELPGDERLERYFFPGERGGGRDGLLVRVRPSGGEPWIGTFGFGVHQPNGISCILSMPDPERLCVVARGAGYVVSTRVPTSWEPVKAVPIIDARAVVPAGVVVFANLTELVAYGVQGVRWRTERLAWDGLKIVAVTGHSLVGEYWDIREESMRRFEVDLADGSQRGGVAGPAPER